MLTRIGHVTVIVRDEDAAQLDARGVVFREQPWGASAVFEDLHGNSFNLLQPRR
jgi:catechol 2,3-dioxygenase-like lactoylglutathione lyase family enzyme